MNERADRLAARGAQGMRSRGGMIYVPTDGGGRGHGLEGGGGRKGGTYVTLSTGG
jgi:hypothetical protein